MTSFVDRSRDDPREGSVEGSADAMIDGLKALAADEPLTLNVSGQCMEPAIPDGTEIVVSPRTRYWPGDVIAFRSAAGELRVHRLIGYRWREGRLLLQTRADASGTLDEPFPKQRVIGRVVAATRAAALVTPRDRLKSVARFVRLRLRGALDR